jgi:hypothetical protein
MSDQLTPGTVFPDLTLNVAGGAPLSVPKDLDSSYSVVLFYRGHW